jgi:hypothetical protein
MDCWVARASTSWPAGVKCNLSAARTVTSLPSASDNAATYRHRYDDFPEPIVAMGMCVLWRRQDIEAWAKATGRKPKAAGD